MPPKGGRKRQSPSGSADNEERAQLAPPDRATWPGWVELESEPAIFNVMLKDIGVLGVKVQEVYSLDDEMLAILPKPVHALIFLFKYRESQVQDNDSEVSSEHIWFANQTPDFACATFALLNIVNNVPGLTLGRELQQFKDFTQDMDPLSKGDAIDQFAFVRAIHNSFAREGDLLAADVYLQTKANRHKKRRAAVKAAETKRMKLIARKGVNGTAVKEEAAQHDDLPFERPSRTRKAPKQFARTNGSDGSADDEYSPTAKQKADTTQDDKPSTTSAPRRSTRKPKPRQTTSASSGLDDDDDEGFHFVAYMPIKGRVWKLDGLETTPLDVGCIESAGGDWMHVVQPELLNRMAQYEASEIQFNLMAIVHDSSSSERDELIQNVKAISTINARLDATSEDWRSLEGAETKKDTITTASTAWDISAADIDEAKPSGTLAEEIGTENEMLALIALRSDLITQQSNLRAAVRDGTEAGKADDEKARHCRHDYDGFARAWLGALAENELLSALLEEE